MKFRLVIFIISLIGFGVYNHFTSARRDGSGDIVSEGQIGSFEIKQGDCFNNTDFSNLTTLPAVPCAEPHDNEVYAVFDIPLPTYESDDETFRLAVEACTKRFDNFVGRTYEDSKLDILTLYPTLATWEEGDRGIVCAVFDVDGEKLMGTAEGLGI